MYHFQSPDPSDPHLELALHSSDVVELDTFPPASAGGFPPEQKQFLGHTDSVAVCEVVTFDVGPQTRKSDTTNDSLVRLSGTVAPVIIVVEATECMSAISVDCNFDYLLTLQ